MTIFLEFQLSENAEVMFTASRKNKVWAIFTAMLALTLTLLTLNPNDAVTINYSLFLRLAVNVTTADWKTNNVYSTRSLSINIIPLTSGLSCKSKFDYTLKIMPKPEWTVQ